MQMQKDSPYASRNNQKSEKKKDSEVSNRYMALTIEVYKIL